jgi:uncharacterized protein
MKFIRVLSFNLVVTGSNARLLSHEMTSSLTGRYIQIAVFPFSFAEYLNFHQFSPEGIPEVTPKKKGALLGLINNYLINGGYTKGLVIKFVPVWKWLI